MTVSNDSPAISAAPEIVNLLEPRVVLGAIADPVRCALLRALADGAASLNL